MHSSLGNTPYNYILFPFPPISFLSLKDPLFSWLRDFQLLPTVNFKTSQTYVFPKLLGKIEFFQHISSSNSTLLLSMFKFPSPNNRFPLPTNTILPTIGILCNLVTSFLLFPLLLFYLHHPTKTATLILWFHREAALFFCLFISVLVLYSIIERIQSHLQSLLQEYHKLNYYPNYKYVSYGLPQGLKISLCVWKFLFYRMGPSQATILHRSKNKEQNSSFQNRRLCLRTSVDPGICLNLIGRCWRITTWEH